MARVDQGESPQDILDDGLYRRKARLRSKQEAQFYRAALEEIYAAICHVGSFLDNAPRHKKYDVKEFLQYYFAAKTLDTMRTVYRWFKERYSDDVWVLIRLTYESYLRMTFIRNDPRAPDFFMALAGIPKGTHEYEKTANGKTNYGRIVDRKTHEAVKNFSNREMIKSKDSQLDLEIYEEFYAFLSSYAHMGLDADVEYFDFKEGFHVHKDDDPLIAIQFATIAITLWFEELSRVNMAKEKSKRDLRYMTKRLRKFQISMLEAAGVDRLPPLLKLIHERLRKTS